MKFRKSIFTAASPNTQKNDAILALKMLVQPWKWDKFEYNEKFIADLKTKLNVKYVGLTDSGRSSLMMILKTLNLGHEDEVIMPSFTCVVVANAVVWAGAKPVYLDTNEADFNAYYSSIESFITSKTKAIVVQHTFGKRVDVDIIRKNLLKLNRPDIFIVEDFAHLIQEGIKLKGDIGFTTFGIEKIISSVRGGAIFTNNDTLIQLIDKTLSNLNPFPKYRTFISLLNPIFWWIAIPLHSVGFGRFTIGAVIRAVWRKLGFLGIMVESSENQAIKPKWFPCKMSPALSVLGIKQLEKLNYYNEYRTKIARIYHNVLSGISDENDFDKNRVYIRYPILLNSRKDFLKVWNFARQERVTLGNWFEKPLYGSTVGEETYKKLCYIPATTPKTLSKSGLTLNLPTSVNISEARAKELAEGIARVLSLNSELW